MSMKEEEDPELKAAKQNALDARQELDAAEERVKKADKELERIEQRKTPSNLDAEDQGAIQGATQQGIQTIR